MPRRFQFQTLARALAPVFVLALLLPLPEAHAQSRRDREAAQELAARMEAAEARYRDAMVHIANADPQGMAEADTALEDMEDILTACGKVRGCSAAGLATSYKRLLKLHADVEAGAEPLEPVELDHHLHPLVHDVPEAARAAALLAGDNHHEFDRMVEFNPAVQEGIRRWLTDMRGAFVTAYENYQYLRHRMWPHYERAGLPEALLFGIMAKESGGRVHSVSRAGAAGPLQFMYTTGQRFGLGPDSSGFDTRYDPYSASAASVAYLNERLAELNGNIEMSLAAYNGGEGRARRIHRESPRSSFWHEDVYHRFPPETRDYVPMVIAAAWLFLHPREYGLDLPRVNVRPAALVLEQPASIYQLTICLGNNGVREGYMRALRNLNPRYRADEVIPAGTALMSSTRINSLYKRHCLEGRRAELARTLVSSNPDTAVIRRGAAPLAPVAPELAPDRD